MKVKNNIAIVPSTGIAGFNAELDAYKKWTLERITFIAVRQRPRSVLESSTKPILENDNRGLVKSLFTIWYGRRRATLDNTEIYWKIRK